MPLGLWKSKWEIHREDMTRFWSEMDRRHEEVKKEAERRRIEFEAQMQKRDGEFQSQIERWTKLQEESDRRWAELQEKSDRRWTELQEKSDALREDYNRELAESRQFNREVLLRMEKTYANMNATLVYIGEELAELKAAVKAQTEAIMKLVDRFDEWEGRAPGGR
jgi:chromosome segregation ATPase